MQSIDVHDLPDPVAEAIAAMVETLRTGGRTAKHDATSPTVGQILAPIFDAAANLRREPGAPHHGKEAEIAQAVIDKFARQGLTL